jgi:molybdopterin synthase sulfur carrier subunit
MVRVEFLGPIDKEAMELEIGSLNELAKILSEDSTLAQWLKNSAVAVNDTIVRDRETPLKDGDRVSILPPVCGG